MKVVGWLVGCLLVGGAALRACFVAFDLDLERHAVVLWSGIILVSCASGLSVAVRTRRMPSLPELVATLLVGLGAALLAAGLLASGEGMAAAPWRALVPGPAAVGLSIYFGASLGYLIWGSGEARPTLGYEAMVGRRFLLAKSSETVSVVTTISLLGVAFGVWLVIVALGVLGGFETDLQKKIIGANAHVVVQEDTALPFTPPEDFLSRISRVPGVVAAAPYLEGEVAFASSSNYTVGVLYGIDPERSPEVLDVLKALKQGSLQPLVDDMRPTPARPPSHSEFLAPKPVAGMVIGSEAAKILNVTVGDRVRAISPLLEVLTPVGPAPRSLDFKVAAIFTTKMYEFDSRYAYVAMPPGRRFFDLASDEVSGVQIRVHDAEHSDRVAADVLHGLPADGRHYEALDWKARNNTLFSALKLERVVAFVVLVLIVFVAGFSIVNTLTMSVIERARAIAIFKAMGALDAGVVKIFLTQGLLVGAFGTIIGAVTAVLTALGLQQIRFGIPDDVYYIDVLPVHVGAWDVAVVVMAGLVIVWDFAVWPALRGARLKPVEGLRDG